MQSMWQYMREPYQLLLQNPEPDKIYCIQADASPALVTSFAVQRRLLVSLDPDDFVANLPSPMIRLNQVAVEFSFLRENFIDANG